MTTQTRGRSKAWLWSGVVVGVVGIGALIAVAAADLGKADQIASVVGVVLAAAGLGLSLWGQFGGGGVATPAPAAPAPAVPAPAAPEVTASGAGAVAAGGNIGSVATGRGTSPAPAPTPTAPASVVPAPAAPGSVTASGDRSVAAGGDIGSVSTGDA
ncbi:hypothetical protein [Streptomyces sp. NBC_00572]|uniref:hypothetical protein n=1 Tax=Streptomyces sp. NBC_00572 TaxID=2903664 RepID=UPI002256C8C6|nr:hypothetical protein [Streptomyces sp. NBC_00572]MCX4981791.1 hypothetical protein [Streptomyces sp. NBC_00572]